MAAERLPRGIGDIRQPAPLVVRRGTPARKRRWLARGAKPGGRTTDVDFYYESRKEMIKVPKGAGVSTVGAYIFENEWQSVRTRQKRELDTTTAPHTYAAPGRYTIAVKVIDIFGNDTMTLVPVTVG